MLENGENGKFHVMCTLPQYKENLSWRRKKDCAEGNLSYDRIAEADILM